MGFSPDLTEFSWLLLFRHLLCEYRCLIENDKFAYLGFVPFFFFLLLSESFRICSCMSVTIIFLGANTRRTLIKISSFFCPSILILVHGFIVYSCFTDIGLMLDCPVSKSMHARILH